MSDSALEAVLIFGEGLLSCLQQTLRAVPTLWASLSIIFRVEAPNGGYVPPEALGLDSSRRCHTLAPQFCRPLQSSTVTLGPHWCDPSKIGETWAGRPRVETLHQTNHSCRPGRLRRSCSSFSLWSSHPKMGCQQGDHGPW